MTQPTNHILAWAEAARQKLQNGGITEADIDALLKGVKPVQTRQRVLYLHATQPALQAEVINAALHEPVEGAEPMIDPLAPELPYPTVAAAVRDGWRIVQFPDQRAPFDDREIDVLGYEFILEKLEAYCD